MGRARDLANILSSSGNVALDSELGLSLITPTSITVTDGSGSIGASGAVSFTGATSVSLNNCFSSTYNNYRVIINSTASTNFALLVRLRAAGSDNTTFPAYIATVVSTGSSAPGGARNTDSVWYFVSNTETNFKVSADIYNPFLSVPTLHTMHSVSNSGNSSIFLSSGQHTQSISYDGISLIPSTGNMTGEILVYGYRK